MNPKAFAVFAVALVVCSAFCVTATLEEREEPDGVIQMVPIALVYLMGVLAASGTVSGLIGGGVVGWFLNDFFDSSDPAVQPYMRQTEGDNLRWAVSTASAFSSNAVANYSLIWGLTKEHWVRQAELEAYAEWSHGARYDADSVLEGSRIYENASVMTANAVAQFNSFMAEVSDKVARYSGTETYDGDMSVGFRMDGNSVLTSSNDVSGELVSVADVRGTTGRVYVGEVAEDYIVATQALPDGATSYLPAYLYNFGGTARMVAEDGTVYMLSPGRTAVSDVRSVIGDRPLESGIYTLSGALVGGDSLAAVRGSDVTLRAGLAMTVDGDVSLAVLDGDSVRYGGGTYNTIKFAVDPKGLPSDGRDPEDVDLTVLLRSYQALLEKIRWTTVSADGAAAAVWDVYDRMDAKNVGVTTLMSSNVYDSVVLSEGMNEVLTLSAMRQVAEYFEANGGDVSGMEVGLYASGMDAPFVRGSVYDELGNPLYDDVIFTPFFQSEDVVLSVSSDHAVSQNCLLAVWSDDGMELTSWYASGMHSEGWETAFVEKGYTFKIQQLATCDSDGMHSVPSIALEVSKMRYEGPGGTSPPTPPDPDDAKKNLLKVLLIVLGGLLAVLGVLRRDPLPVVAGVAMVLFALFVADPLWRWLT